MIKLTVKWLKSKNPNEHPYLIKSSNKKAFGEVKGIYYGTKEKAHETINSAVNTASKRYEWVKLERHCNLPGSKYAPKKPPTWR